MAVKPRSRSTERGAAVFIVVLAITLLTAIGIFAIRTAAMVDAAAGYDRQSVQSYYLGEYAGRMSASYTVDLVNSIATRLSDNTKWETCIASGNSKNFPCVKFYGSEFGNRVNLLYSGQKLIDPQTTSGEGSLGPMLPPGSSSSLDADFLAELTDPGDTSANPGYHAEGRAGALVNMQVAVTAVGLLRNTPATPTNSFCPAVTLSAIRTHMTLPNKAQTY